MLVNVLMGGSDLKLAALLCDCSPLDKHRLVRLLRREKDSERARAAMLCGTSKRVG